MNKEIISKVAHGVGNVATVAASTAAIVSVINEKRDIRLSRQCSNFGVTSYAVACAAYVIERFENLSLK